MIIFWCRQNFGNLMNLSLEFFSANGRKINLKFCKKRIFISPHNWKHRSWVDLVQKTTELQICFGVVVFKALPFIVCELGDWFSFHHDGSWLPASSQGGNVVPCSYTQRERETGFPWLSFKGEKFYFQEHPRKALLICHWPIAAQDRGIQILFRYQSSLTQLMPQQVS